MPSVLSSLLSVVVNPSNAPTIALSMPWKAGFNDATTFGVRTRTRALNSQIIGRKACAVDIVARIFEFSESCHSSVESVSMGPDGYTRSGARIRPANDSS